MRLIEYLSKPPLPTFGSKQCAKRGGTFSGEYSTSLVLRPCAFIACSTKFAQKAWSILSHDHATDICLHQTQHNYQQAFLDHLHVKLVVWCADEACRPTTLKPRSHRTSIFCDNVTFCDNTNGLRYTRIVIGNPTVTQVLPKSYQVVQCSTYSGASQEQKQLELSFTPFLVVSKPEVLLQFPHSQQQIGNLFTTKITKKKKAVSV